MAGPSVMVRVLGDLSGLSKSFQSAQTAGAKAAAGLHTAFTGMLGALNQSGVLGPFGEALNNIDSALERVAGHAKEVGPAMIGVGTALAGVGVGLAALGSKDQAAHAQLQAAVEATGRSYDDYAKSVDAAVKHQERFGDTASQTQDALRILTQATGDPTKALGYLSTATDLAAAKHESLDQAATTLGKAYNGSAKVLKEFGIQISAKSTQQQRDNALVTLSAKLHGQAAAAADTFGGKMSALKARVEDAAAAFGQKYGPVLTAAGTGMAALGSLTTAATGILGAYKTAQEGAAAATETMAAAEDTAAVSEGLALAPILAIVLALAALGIAAYEIYTHWTTIWNGMKDAAKAVWDWIKTNWPLLVGILLGPFGLAVYAIYRYWDQITGGAAAVFNWFRNNWPLLVDILLGPFGVAATQIYEHWNGIVNWFTGLPRTIGHIFEMVADAITYPFKAAFDAIADIWNNTVGSLSFKIPSWVPGLGGDGFSMPKIPHLAQGGLITQTGLVLAHAGEAITPIDKVPRGPAVMIQEAHFNDPVDVELLLRKAAWHVQTARI